MPDWLRDVLIAAGAFVGGRTVNGISEQMKEGRELRRGVDRLTIAVEKVSEDLRNIRNEIHGQVAGLKVEIHEQVGGLREELHTHQVQQEVRFGNIEERMDATSSRIDALSARSVAMGERRRQASRLNQEIGCYQLAEGDAPNTDA